MVQDLQNHDDWYDGEPASQLLGQPRQSNARTILVDDEGFTQVPPPRSARRGTTPSPTSIPAPTVKQNTGADPNNQNRYQVLIDDVLEQMTAHAKVLEIHAVEQHHTQRLTEARRRFKP